MARYLQIPGLSHQDDMNINYDMATTVDADVLEIPVTHGYVAKETGGDTEELTLADGVPGQVLIVHLTTYGGGVGILTPDTKTGFSNIVFADDGDQAVLIYVNDFIGWVILSLSSINV